VQISRACEKVLLTRALISALEPVRGYLAHTPRVGSLHTLHASHCVLIPPPLLACLRALYLWPYRAPRLPVSLYATPLRSDAVRVEADAEAALLRMELRRQGFFGEDLEKIVVVAGVHIAGRLREECATLQASLSDQKRNERRAINDAIHSAKDAWFKVRYG
jgi:hypothetical protein